MLSDHELRDWLENLAQTNLMRRRIIIELLRHKAEDCMSSDDAADCQKALKLLDADLVHARPGPRHIAPPSFAENEH